MSKNKIVISANGQPLISKVKEILEYRELLWMLAWRDFRVKYAQSFLGFAWAFINPIATLVILTFVFGTVAKVNTGEIPHAIYTLAGLCGWTFFASLASDAGRSMLSAQAMIKKIYFPRLIIPLSKVFTSLIDFIIVLLCMALMMIYYQFVPSENILWLPLFIFIAILAGIAMGIWISALTIRFRDFQYVMPLILRLGMYATPIAFPASEVPEKYKLLFFLNPLAGVVEGMKWSLLGASPFPTYIWLSGVILIIVFILGIIYFQHMERVISDII